MPAIKPQKGTILTPNGHWSQRGLVGCWIMNEGQGNIFFDSAGRSSGNTNNATWRKGLNGPVLEMNGSQSRFSLSIICNGFSRAVV